MHKSKGGTTRNQNTYITPFNGAMNPDQPDDDTSPIILTKTKIIVEYIESEEAAVVEEIECSRKHSSNGSGDEGGDRGGEEFTGGTRDGEGMGGGGEDESFEK